MTGMRAYYLSRAVLSAAIGAFAVFAGSVWWIGIIVGVVSFAFFWLAPRLGRYAVHPEAGVTALRRDERLQAINAAAGLNAFVVSMLGLAGVIIYFGMLSARDVPVMVLEALLILGALVYYSTDFWLRRTQA